MWREEKRRDMEGRSEGVLRAQRAWNLTRNDLANEASIGKLRWRHLDDIRSWNAFYSFLSDAIF